MLRVTLELSDELEANIDELVRQMKSEPRASSSAKPTEAQRAEAHKIAEKKGAFAANEYLRSLKITQPKITRMGVMVQLLEVGYIETVRGLKAKP